MTPSRSSIHAAVLMTCSLMWTAVLVSSSSKIATSNEEGVLVLALSLTYQDVIPVNTRIPILQNSQLRDIPMTEPIRVFFENSNFQFLNDFFNVNDNGELIALRTVDRDDRDGVCGPLKCCEEQSCGLEFDCTFVPVQPGAWKRVRVRVTLQLRDMNDNPPVFPMEEFNLTIDEADFYPNSLDLPQARDADYNAHGLKYHLKGHEGYSMFSLWEQRDLLPRLRIIRGLDYENLKERHFQFYLVAVDGGFPERSGSIKLNLQVNDVNDETPKCEPLKKEITLAENRTFPEAVYRVNCTDRDSGFNAELRYSFGTFLQPPSGRSKFRVDSKTGEVFLTAPLDYEKFSERQFILPIQAKDLGLSPKSAMFTLTVVVSDVNDNAPALKVKQNKTVPENFPPGIEVISLYASDEDVLSQGKIRCSPKSTGGGQLRLETPTSSAYLVYTNATFDYEAQQTASLIVDCTDGELTSEFHLTVAITDLNDNDPEFTPPCPLQRDVLESAEMDSPLFLVTARDADSGDFGTVSYSILDAGEKYFQIEPKTGSVSLLRPIDREEQLQHQLVVVARDGGKRSATCEVRISVKDFNDCAPEMLSDATVEVEENTPLGTLLTTLHFQDRDEGVNSQFDLKLVFPPNQFEPDGTNITTPWMEVRPDGALVLLRQLDREQLDIFQVEVVAVDRGLVPLTSTATLNIRVLDLNDNAPQMVSPPMDSIVGHRPMVYRDSPYRHPVIQMVASDKDYGNNATIHFRLLASNGSELFYVNESSGMLYTSWTPSQQPEESTYEVSVELFDLGTPQSQKNTSRFFVVIASPLEGEELQKQTIAHISNIVILALIVVLSVALGAALIAAIIWAKARTSLPPSPRWSAQPYGCASNSDYGPQMKMLMDPGTSNTFGGTLTMDGTLLNGATCRNYDLNGYPTMNLHGQRTLASYADMKNPPQYYSTLERGALSPSLTEDGYPLKISECSLLPSHGGPLATSTPLESMYAMDVPPGRSLHCSSLMSRRGLMQQPLGSTPPHSGDDRPSSRKETMNLDHSGARWEAGLQRSRSGVPYVDPSTEATGSTYSPWTKAPDHQISPGPSSHDPSHSRSGIPNTSLHPQHTLVLKAGLHPSTRSHYQPPQLYQRQADPDASRRQSQMSIADSGRGGSEDDFLKQQQLILQQQQQQATSSSQPLQGTIC